MKRLLLLLIAAVFLLSLPVSHGVLGAKKKKGKHMRPAGQICHVIGNTHHKKKKKAKKKTPRVGVVIIARGGQAMKRHLGHGDCLLEKSEEKIFVGEPCKCGPSEVPK